MCLGIREIKGTLHKVYIFSRYAARYSNKGKSKHIGNYKEEIRAALEVDRAVLRSDRANKRRLNFSNNMERQMVESALYHYKKGNHKKRGVFNFEFSTDNNGFPNNFADIAQNVAKTNKNEKAIDYCPATKF